MVDCCDLFWKKNVSSIRRVGHDWLNWACQVLLHKWLAKRLAVIDACKEKYMLVLRSTVMLAHPQWKRTVCFDKYLKEILKESVFQQLLWKFWENICGVFEGFVNAWLIKIKVVLLIMIMRHLMEEDTGYLGVL